MLVCVDCLGAASHAQGDLHCSPRGRRERQVSGETEAECQVSWYRCVGRFGF